MAGPAQTVDEAVARLTRERDRLEKEYGGTDDPAYEFQRGMTYAMTLALRVVEEDA